MKNLVKLALAFILGIIITITVIIPKFQVPNVPAEPAPTPDIQAEIKEAVDAAVAEALANAAKVEPEEVQAEETPEPVEVKEVGEVEETTEPELEVTTTPEPTQKVEKASVQPTSSPQVKKNEPEYFYEDGKKYAYINGFKSLITDEPDGQIDTYDWENDPLSEVKGPFN